VRDASEVDNVPHATSTSDSLDQRYADTWDSLPSLTRWWYAASKQ